MLRFEASCLPLPLLTLSEHVSPNSEYLYLLYNHKVECEFLSVLSIIFNSLSYTTENRTIVKSGTKYLIDPDFYISRSTTLADT